MSREGDSENIPLTERRRAESEADVKTAEHDVYFAQCIEKYRSTIKSKACFTHTDPLPVTDTPPSF
jgi:hypothetical protein